MASSSLPPWVQILQALAVPTIAVVGAWVAVQQMLIARAKLRHDLYDRRFAVYQAARKLLVEIIQQGHPSREQINEYVINTADASFLMNDEIAKYLGKIRKRASRLRAINAMQKHERIALQQQDQDDVLFAWMTEQLPVGLVEKFKPFLTLEPPRATVRTKALSICSRLSGLVRLLQRRISAIMTNFLK